MLLLVMNAKTPYAKGLLFCTLIRKAFRVLFSKNYSMVWHCETQAERELLGEVCETFAPAIKSQKSRK